MEISDTIQTFLDEFKTHAHSLRTICIIKHKHKKGGRQ